VSPNVLTASVGGGDKDRRSRIVRLIVRGKPAFVQAQLRAEAASEKPAPTSCYTREPDRGAA